MRLCCMKHFVVVVVIIFFFAMWLRQFFFEDLWSCLYNLEDWSKFGSLPDKSGDFASMGGDQEYC